jgi:hypothetical protein
MTTQTSGSGTRSTDRSKQAIREEWPIFAEEVQARLAMGAEIYGDQSFDAASDRLVVEIQQELMDVLGWGFILWCRFQALKTKLAELERRATAQQAAGNEDPHAISS